MTFQYSGPGFYRTLDGRKAHVCDCKGKLYGVVFPGGKWPNVIGDVEWFMESGQNGRHGERDIDLVAIWEDE